MDQQNSTILAALESGWEAIRKHQPDIPPVRIILASGMQRGVYKKRGHWWAKQWREGEEEAHEVLIAGERLADGAEQVFTTLMHEAAHALAFAREIKDVSRQNRYHNTRFKAFAEEIGCAVEKNDRFGHVTTGPSPVAWELYSEEIAALEKAIGKTYRVRAKPKAAPKRETPKTCTLSCQCGRKIRVMTEQDNDEILCLLCDTLFE